MAVVVVAADIAAYRRSVYVPEGPEGTIQADEEEEDPLAEGEEYYVSNRGGILREQLLLAKTAGVRSVVVLVNKMDMIPSDENDEGQATTQQQQKVFEAIRKHISTRVLPRIGFKEPLLVLPCSVTHDLNISYPGYTFLFFAFFSHFFFSHFFFSFLSLSLSLPFLLTNVFHSC